MVSYLKKTKLHAFAVRLYDGEVPFEFPSSRKCSYKNGYGSERLEFGYYIDDFYYGVTISHLANTGWFHCVVVNEDNEIVYDEVKTIKYLDMDNIVITYSTNAAVNAVVTCAQSLRQII